MVKEILRELEKRMKNSIEHFRKDLSKLRTGRANIHLFEDIKVEYYGNLTPLNQVATLGVPEPTLITIKPWDPSLLRLLIKPSGQQISDSTPLMMAKFLRFLFLLWMRKEGKNWPSG